MSGFVYYGGRALLLAALACSLTASGFGQANVSQPDPQPAANSSIADPIAMLRLPPLPVLTENLLAVARQIQPGPQTEMVPLMFLGAFGYPDFQGVSATENVSVFLLETQQGAMAAMPPVVILANIAADSPARAAIEGYGMQVQDRQDGWILIAFNPMFFDLIGDLSPWIKKAQSPKDYDIELMVEFDATRLDQWMTPIVQGLSANILHDLEGDADEANALIQEGSAFVKACMSNFEHAKLGIDIDSEALGAGFSMQAVLGSPEATLLSSPAGGELTVAHSLAADAMMVHAGKVSAQAWLDYMDVMQARLAAHIKHEKLSSILELANELKIAMQPFSGEWASTTDIDLANSEVRGLHIYGGNFQEEAFVAAYQKLVNEYLHNTLTLLSRELQQGIQYEFKANVGSHNDVPLHQLSLVLEGDSAEGDDNDNTAPAADPFTAQDIYLAIVDGDLLMAQPADELKLLIDNVKSGEPVENNIADKVVLEAGQASRTLVDLRSYAQMIFGLLPIASSPEAKAALEQFYAADVAPMRGFFSHTAGRFHGGAEVPVASIAKIAEAYQAAKQSAVEPSMEYPTAGESAPTDAGQ